MGMPWKVKEVWKKNNLYDELSRTWNVYGAGELAMCLGDYGGHVGFHVDGFYGVCGGYGVSHWNFEGKVLLWFSREKELCRVSQKIHTHFK